MFNPVLNLLSNGTSDRSVLFEPYSSLERAGGVISKKDNFDGTLTICRARLREHKFQPGFDYFFAENQGSDPVNVSKYDFPVPPVCLHTFDYPITIAQLGDAPTNTGIVPVVCTKGLYCATESFVSGKIYSTQILGSMNIKEEELDAIQVKDPELYSKLMSQYYYILNKESESGIKLEEKFYKP
ncbi:MAG: hypothetical protein CFE24_14545 [Flavobacterium sp. BFFFF2]|nr:MAG: hypothetical protein CFE24_14545 [Flavobacterium sp. BFFFF2]